jgi:hypothetical protein
MSPEVAAPADAADAVVPTPDSAALADAPAAPRLPPDEAIEAWEGETRQLSALLRTAAPDAAWLGQFETARQRQRVLAQRDADHALYLLLQAAATQLDRYSAHHAMLCAVVCDLCAECFDWPDGERESLQRAALSMNLSMTVMQDTLARQVGPLTSTQRESVANHAAGSAELLNAAGVTDALWLETVRDHHTAQGALGRSALEQAPPAQRLAHLLHRVDVYTAKLSRRASREPVSPAIAARDACLGDEGRPDPVGAAMLRTLGLYPPGCFVQLASGEIGVVVRRGDKAHTPLVAALRRQDGGLFLQPSRRDTSQPRHAIVKGVNAREVKVHLNHLRTLNAA